MNLVFFIVHLRAERSSEAAFRDWSSNHPIAILLVGLLSVVSLHNTQLLECGLFNWQCFKAPYSKSFERRKHLFGLLSTFFEDVPQLAVFVYMQFSWGEVTQLSQVCITWKSVLICLSLLRAFRPNIGTELAQKLSKVGSFRKSARSSQSGQENYTVELR